MTGPLPALALLVTGHLLADFVLQTGEMKARKGELAPTSRHALVVTLTHIVLFVPYLTWTTLGLLVLVGATHLVIDMAKGRLRDPDRPKAPLFVADQAAHLLVLVGVWMVLPPDLAVHPWFAGVLA